MSTAKKWADKLSPYQYHMDYSNMNNDQALQIAQAVIGDILSDIDDENDGYSSVEGMLERVYEHIDTIRAARQS